MRSVPYLTAVISCLQNDRKWCIIEQESHAVITAREVAKVSTTRDIARRGFRAKMLPFLNQYQMVLITPRIEPDSASPHGGRLVISFPEDSGCEAFSVPLNPTPDILANWPMYVVMSVSLSWGSWP